MKENYAKTANPNVPPLTKMEGEEKLARGISQWVLLGEERFFQGTYPFGPNRPWPQTKMERRRRKTPLGKCSFAWGNLLRKCDFASGKWFGLQKTLVFEPELTFTEQKQAFTQQKPLSTKQDLALTKKNAVLLNKCNLYLSKGELLLSSRLALSTS